MEEKQVESKQEAVPAEEPKRPFLLSIILIFEFFSEIFMLIAYFSYMSPYKHISGIIIISLLAFIKIITVIMFWKGYNWARIFSVILILIATVEAMLKVSIYPIQSYSAIVFDVMMILYILLNKNVKAYCRK